MPYVASEIFEISAQSAVCACGEYDAILVEKPS